ncbi:MAG: SIR2 family protein, partial [Myxococcales bacterium]|nr:SIR2 family protein [Myxococcales bacterium]
RPFDGPGDGYEQLRVNVVFGRLRPAPVGSKVPSWLRKVVCRGLETKAEDRYGSMQVLLDALLEGEVTHETYARQGRGFVADDPKEIWRRLLTPVANGKVVPIIGPRLLEAAHGSTHDTALHLAGSSHFPMPLHEWDDLPKVTAYLSVKESRYNVIQAVQEQLLRDLLAQHGDWLPAKEIPPKNPKPKLGRLLALVGDHLREDEDDPYRILAEIPAPVYVTTNFDPLLERALKANERMAQQVVTRWRHKRAPAAAKAETFEEPSARKPLVYHVFGAFGVRDEDCLVLTEDDYFDYLINTVAAKLIPSAVEGALVDNSLLFLGFRLTDWHFRVLFRLMMNLPGRERLRHYRHVAVQLDPDMQAMADIDGAKAYLAEYFGKEANVDIFWGSSAEFLASLREELRGVKVEMEVEEEEEGMEAEWNF